jgi:hypothetical protein
MNLASECAFLSSRSAWKFMRLEGLEGADVDSSESDEGLRGLDPKKVDLRGVIDSRSRASGESL